MEQIKAYLDQLATISKEDWDFFTSKLHRRVISKKTIFLKVDEIEAVDFWIKVNDPMLLL